MSNSYIVTNGEGSACSLWDVDQDHEYQVLKDLPQVNQAIEAANFEDGVPPQIYLLVPLPHTAAVAWLEKLVMEGRAQDYMLRECAMRNSGALEWPAPFYQEDSEV